MRFISYFLSQVNIALVRPYGAPATSPFDRKMESL